MFVSDPDIQDQKLGNEIASFDLDTGEILSAKVGATVNAWQARASFSPDGRHALIYASGEKDEEPSYTLVGAVERGKFETLQELPENVRDAMFFSDTVIVTATDQDVAAAASPPSKDAKSTGTSSQDLVNADLEPPKRRVAQLLVSRSNAWTPEAAPEKLAAADVTKLGAVSRGTGIVVWTASGALLLEPSGAGAISVARIVSPPPAHWIDTVTRRMLTGGGDGIFRVIDVDRGVEVFSLDLGTDSIGEITATPDGQRVLVSTFEELQRQVHVIGGDVYRTEGEAGWRPGFDRLLTKAPPAGLRRARAALLRGETDQALKIAASLSPDWKAVFGLDVRRERAARALAVADEARATAASAVSRVFQGGVRDPAALAAIARDLDAAAGLQREAAAVNPQLPSISPSVSLAQSVLTWVAEDYAATEQILRPAIKANPRDGSLRSNLASALLALGKNKEAVSAFEVAMDLPGGSSGDSRAGLALARARAGIPDPDLLEDIRGQEFGISSGDVNYLMDSYLWRRQDAEELSVIIRQARAAAGQRQ